MMKPPEVSHFRGLHHIDCDFAFSNESAWNHSHSLVRTGRGILPPPLSKNFSTFFENKKAACFKFEVNRWRVEIFIFMMYNM
jgi:hypothetical protein